MTDGTIGVKQSFNNFIVKHHTDLWKIGYTNPEEKLSLKSYYNFFKDRAVAKVRSNLYLHCKDVLAKNLGVDQKRNSYYGYYRNSYSYNSYFQNDIVSKKDNNYTFSSFIFNITKKIKKMGIENHKKILEDAFNAGSMVKNGNWAKRPEDK